MSFCQESNLICHHCYYLTGCGSVLYNTLGILLNVCSHHQRRQISKPETGLLPFLFCTDLTWSVSLLFAPYILCFPNYCFQWYPFPNIKYIKFFLKKNQTSVINKTISSIQSKKIKDLEATQEKMLCPNVKHLKNVWIIDVLGFLTQK